MSDAKRNPESSERDVAARVGAVSQHGADSEPSADAQVSADSQPRSDSQLGADSQVGVDSQPRAGSQDESLSRLEREAAFHDQTAEDETREPAAKFYAATRTSHDFYIDTIRNYARGGDVLDYGCGTGERTCTIARSGAHVIGIDISSGAIAVAAQKVREAHLEDRIELRVMNAEALEFADASFDVVCGTSILHHLDLDASYREIRRVLKPGGVAVFDEPLGHNRLINWYRRRTPQMRTVDEHPMLIEEIEKARDVFAQIDVRYFHIASLATVPLRNTALFKPLYAVAEAIDRGIMTLVPPMRRWAWRVVMILRT